MRWGWSTPRKPTCYERTSQPAPSAGPNWRSSGSRSTPWPISWSRWSPLRSCGDVSRRPCKPTAGVDSPHRHRSSRLSHRHQLLGPRRFVRQSRFVHQPPGGRVPLHGPRPRRSCSCSRPVCWSGIFGYERKLTPHCRRPWPWPQPTRRPGASGQVLYQPDSQLFVVDVQNLPPLAPGQVYEVWLIGADGPKPAGVFDQPTAEHALIADRSQYQTIAITAEPGPLGTAAPTGEIVATATL